MSDPTVIAASIGGGTTAIGSLLAFLGGRHKARTDATQARLEAERESDAQVDARWQGMLDQQRQGFDAQLVPMRQDIADLRGRVESLSADVHHRDGIIATLVTHIRLVITEWRRLLPADDPPPPPPTISHLI